jgi:hypothetical protein
MPDWTDLGNFDWNTMEWTSESWQTFLQTMNGGTASGGDALLEICPIVEFVIGIGQEYGIAGDCSCQEVQGGNLTIQCGFQDLCLEGDTVCASAGLNFTVDQGSGSVNTSVCMEVSDVELPEVCFSYQMDSVDAGSTGAVFEVVQTCDASYGGKPCKCDIQDDLCLLVDCSAYLPGATMDTCQQLAFDNTQDAISMIPPFNVFDRVVNGSFAFESIDWGTIDWNNIDWQNFGFDRVNWTSMDWPSLTWGSIFPTDMTVVDICPILTQYVLGMDEELSGDCACDGELESGFSVLCSFEKQCTENGANDAIAISQTDSLPSTEICGDIVLDLGFDGVGSVSGNLCVDFEEDIHPTTCIEYSIPIADQESLPTCTATYGSDPCECTIDQNLCVKVDCSAHEETAVMDQCQILNAQKVRDVELLIPRFDIPSPAAEDGEEENTEGTIPEAGEQESGGDSLEGTSDNAASELQKGGSSASSRQTFVALAILSLVFAVTA